MPMAPAKYLAALGRFVHAYSQIEMHMTIVLWIAAKVNFDIAPALLSGVRIDAAIGLIGRVLDARKIDDQNRTDLEATLRQLAILNKMRNDILHYGAKADADGELVVSNKVSAHVESRLRETIVSAQTLDDMTYDLDTIWVRLHVYGFRITAEGMGFSGMPGFDQRLQRPWRYTPPPQASQAGKTPKTPPG
jgi:hypothetical protein